MYNISFKAYKTKELKHLHRSISTSAWIWNHCISLQKRYYSLYGGYINVNKLQKHIAKLRNKNTQWKELNSQSVQEICQRVDDSYKRFFKKLAKRPPKFKRARNFTSFVLKQSGWKIEDNILTINKRRYKFSKSREYENIKRIVVKRNKLGEIFFVLCCDLKPIKYERVGDATIGIDFGLKTLLTLSNGQEIQSPEFFKSSLKAIKSLNRQLSKKKKGSKNRRKSLKNLQRAYIDISNKRNDFEWKLAHELCKRYSFIAITRSLYWKNISNDKDIHSIDNKLYFLKLSSNEDIIYKIGCSRDVARRVGEIRRDSGSDVEVLYTLEGSSFDVYSLENRLVDHFKKYKYKGDNKFPGYTECFGENVWEKYYDTMCCEEEYKVEMDKILCEENGINYEQQLYCK